MRHVQTFLPGNRKCGLFRPPDKGAPDRCSKMNQLTFDLLTKICDKCGGRCCYYAKPPLTEERISILVENGISIDDVVFREHRMLDCKSTGFCVGYSEGRCRVQQVKPETCIAGPFTFDVKNDKLEIYLKKDRICELVTFLKGNPAVYNEQFEMAVQSIRQLVRALPPEELESVCKVEEPETDKVAEYPLAEVFSNDRRN
jgi:Fe-S-cluster containining protein